MRLLIGGVWMCRKWKCELLVYIVCDCSLHGCASFFAYVNNYVYICAKVVCVYTYCMEGGRFGLTSKSWFGQ